MRVKDKLIGAMELGWSFVHDYWGTGNMYEHANGHRIWPPEHGVNRGYTVTVKLGSFESLADAERALAKALLHIPDVEDTDAIKKAETDQRFAKAMRRLHDSQEMRELLLALAEL